jgi:hypothetical protein
MSDPYRLCQLLCGEFCNQSQAFENPPMYAHIQVRVRPLPQLEPGSLLLEQAYTITPNHPYRLRVLQVLRHQGELRIRNLAVQGEAEFFGAGADPTQLMALKTDDLLPLEGCTYLVSQDGDGYRGSIEPGCNCIVERKGQRTYLVSEFEISGDRMLTLDRGHDPVSHELVWGSLAGAFEFHRRRQFADEIPDHWAAAWAE